jgi:DNA-binding MarR family transcriptional regulator
MITEDKMRMMIIKRLVKKRLIKRLTKQVATPNTIWSLSSKGIEIVKNKKGNTHANIKRITNLFCQLIFSIRNSSILLIFELNECLNIFNKLPIFKNSQTFVLKELV